MRTKKMCAEKKVTEIFSKILFTGFNLDSVWEERKFTRNSYGQKISSVKSSFQIMYHC